MNQLNDISTALVFAGHAQDEKTTASFTAQVTTAAKELVTLIDLSIFETTEEAKQLSKQFDRDRAGKYRGWSLRIDVAGGVQTRGRWYSHFDERGHLFTVSKTTHKTCLTRKSSKPAELKALMKCYEEKIIPLRIRLVRLVELKKMLLAFN